MPRFNFNTIAKTEKADADKIGANFTAIEENALMFSDVKDNLSSTDTNKPLSAKQGKILADSITNLDIKIYDTGWKTPTISTPFAATDFKYRKIGKLVQIRGNLVTDSNLSNSQYTLFNLPAGCIPDYPILYQNILYTGFFGLYTDKIVTTIIDNANENVKLKINTTGLPSNIFINFNILYFVN